MNEAAGSIYERVLILRCQMGDEAALEELIARYSAGLRRFLWKMIGQEAMADDLLQETWVEVYRKINGLERPEAFGAWVYRIARDKAYRELRRRKAPGTIQEVYDESMLSKDDDDGALALDDAEEVRVALAALPGEQREVLVLRFIEEMSYEQIAEVIARPLGTVRSRIHYAKAALRAKLKERR